MTGFAAMLESIAARFDVPGPFVHGEPFGSGHIHDTFLVRLGDRDYVLQRLNSTVFPDLEAVGENVRRVCEHIRRKLEERGVADVDRRVLTWVHGHDGGILVRDEQGAAWRMCHRIAGVRSVDSVDTEDQAWQAGLAFGRFQELASDLPPPRLAEVIPDFHHTVRRYEAFEAAVAEDRAGRSARAGPEIAFARARREMAGRLLDLQARGEIPERITHNDTKINNVLLDERTGEALCVIDLDTVMPGLAHYDFGDMVRTVTNAGEEDDRDLDRVEVRMPMFEALAAGYLEAAAGFLNPVEVEHLPFSGKLLTYEVGLRFLTDFLQGDPYFRVHREDHNLDRCRAQFQLVRSLEAREGEMLQAVRRLAAR